MLVLRCDNRRYLARAHQQDCYGRQSADRVDSAPGLERSGAPVFSDRVSHSANSALRHGARAVGPVSDADVVTDFQQSDPPASGADLLWTLSMATIVRGQSRLALGRTPEVSN